MTSDLKATGPFGGGAGRSLGSRNRFSECFIQAVYEDFRVRGDPPAKIGGYKPMLTQIQGRVWYCLLTTI